MALTVGAHPANGSERVGVSVAGTGSPPCAERSAHKNTRGNAIPRGDGMGLRRDASGMFGIIGRLGSYVKEKTYWRLAGSCGRARQVKLEERCSEYLPSLF